jgi:hypothetical protein
MQTRPRPAGPTAASVRPPRKGIGRASSPAAEAVSDALRRGDSMHLRRRRRIAVLQTIATWALSVVGLYQFGVLRHIPEPSLPGLDADAVDASGEAYVTGLTPDSTWGIASAGLSLALRAWAVRIGGVTAPGSPSSCSPRRSVTPRAAYT